MNEVNRLPASGDNGFVTSYRYDADVERTVKNSGESQQVYASSEFAGGRLPAVWQAALLRICRVQQPA